ncbi:MAG: response regulator transcription factor [Gemmatimonadales bacterium]
MTGRGTVLLIEDEPGLVRTLSDRLAAEGWTVETAGAGDTGLALARTGRADIVVLDVMLPGLDGFTVLQRLREEGVVTPVVMLTARGEVDAKVAALRAGADDYLAKPFRAIELLARLDAVLRRVRGAQLSPGERTIAFGSWVLDLERETLQAGGDPVALSRTELELLCYLARNRGRAISRAELLREVWRYSPAVVTRTVDQHVAQLRRKLGGGRHLVTVHGQGYRFHV